jgi:GntR family transcriptional regulator/MocR family aminotransferase
MSPSLPIDLDRTSGQPLYRQIERWIRLAIDAARLPPGTRLPGVRTLARDLGVSVVPVITAYDQLGADGYLVSQVGIGTLVAAEPPTPIARGSVPPFGLKRKDPGATARLPATNRWVPDRPTETPGSREPPTDDDLSHRLGRTWSRHLHRARLAADAGELADPASADPLGDPWLRRLLALRLGLVRPEGPSPDQVIVTGGPQAALAAVARTWLGPGRTCAVAAAHPLEARRALELTGATLTHIDLSEHGLRLGPPRGPLDLVVVAPAIAGPGAQPLSVAARRRLLEWAARVGAIVLEDDRERETGAVDRSLPTLDALDGEGRVVHLGTVPAAVAPGAAIAYLVVPNPLHGPIAAMALGGGQAPSLVEQRALATMLESGDLDRSLRSLRAGRVVTTAPAPRPDRAVGIGARHRAGWVGIGPRHRGRGGIAGSTRAGSGP